MVGINAAYEAIRRGAPAMPRSAPERPRAPSPPQAAATQAAAPSWTTTPPPGAPFPAPIRADWLDHLELLGWLVLLAGAAALVRVLVILLGPPLDTSWFLQAWAAATLAWLGHERLVSPSR